MALQSFSVSHPRWEGPPPSFPPAKYPNIESFAPSDPVVGVQIFSPQAFPFAGLQKNGEDPAALQVGVGLPPVCSSCARRILFPKPRCPAPFHFAQFSQRAKGCSDLQLGVPIRSLRQPQSLPRGPSLRRKLQGTSQADVVRKKSFFAWDGAV